MADLRALQCHQLPRQVVLCRKQASKSKSLTLPWGPGEAWQLALWLKYWLEVNYLTGGPAETAG